jgi:hypothetical protein
VRMPRLVSRSVKVLAVPVLLAGVVAGAAPAVSAAAARPQGPAVSTPFFGQFNAVAASSARQAWGVGYIDGVTLIERWNGKAWKSVRTLRLGPPSSDFYGVAATSAKNAWAVGYSPGENAVSLIAHWNGKSWKQVHSPNFAYTVLEGVAATSAKNAWAVGCAGCNGAPSTTLILRWNGSKWKRVPSPSPGAQGSTLYGVTAISATNAWAVGSADNEGTITTLILHWNGIKWTQVSSPSPASAPQLNSVTATSSKNAWAVGWSNDGGTSLILHWNGATWTQVPSPNPAGSGAGDDNQLQSVTATSAGNAWAVGSTQESLKGSKTFILRWTGSKWKQVPSPNPFCSSCDSLYGVTATSTKSAWAVGTVNSGGIVVILRWNGRSWKNYRSAPQPG